MKKERPYCLSVAGFDPTGGAGVLADIKTFEMLGVYGMAIITGNTLQTDRHFESVDWMSTENVLQQMETLFGEYDFKVMKIGLISDTDMLIEIINKAKTLKPEIQIVWDPILKSSTGYSFHADQPLDMEFLTGNCSLITPNWEEFQFIWEYYPEFLSKHSAVLLKGGHREDCRGCDRLYQNGNAVEIPGKSFGGKSKHGTGCVLSSAISAYLAKGFSLEESCRQGKKYVEKLILSNYINLGYHYDNE